MRFGLCDTNPDKLLFTFGEMDGFGIDVGTVHRFQFWLLREVGHELGVSPDKESSV